MAFCERKLAQGTMWHVKNSVLAVFLVFLFFFHCFLSNVFGMLFPVLAAFVVDLDFFLFSKEKSCLKIV